MAPHTPITIAATHNTSFDDVADRIIRLAHTVDVIEGLLYEADRTTCSGERNVDVDRAHSTLLLVQREFHEIVAVLEGEAPGEAA
ncbi:hypothetical protein [Aminobacter sp. BE322]|uniref:hypothetical protein n=1 Tax=unclassified Aminobacter TaxID=2644704 RepID=UPI003D215FEB